jgi:glycosyltransferase involved in cell wall biosynthesis
MVSNSQEKKIHLVIATDNFLPRRDGVVSFLNEILPRLKKSFTITIICPDSKKRPSISGVSFLFIPLSSKKAGDFNFAKIAPKKIFPTIKKADIVFSQTIGPVGATSLFLAQRLRKKNVSFIHSIDWELASKALSSKILKFFVNRLVKLLAKHLYSRSTHLLIPSESISELLLWKKISTPRTIVHLGVDTTRFTPITNAKDRQARREKIGLDIEDVAICYHGRVAREKDIPTLLRSFSIVCKKSFNTKLVIIGSGVPFLIQKLVNKKDVIHIPVTPHPEKFLPLCDIYCLPSLTETTSLSTLEAMSSQLPVVATPVGFVKDYVKNGKTGYFFPPGNSHELAKKLLYLISHPSKAQMIGLNSRSFVKKHFSWDITAKILEDFFLDLGKSSWSSKSKRRAMRKAHKKSSKVSN